MERKAAAEERKTRNAEYRIDTEAVTETEKITQKITDEIVTDENGNKTITRTVVTIRTDENGNETVIDTATTKHDIKSTEPLSTTAGTADAGH